MNKLFEHFKSRWTNANLRVLREHHHYNKSRWTNAYLRELREHHHYNKNKTYVLHPSVGDVVIIHDDVLKRCD